jgi:hypothetical protein
MAINQPTRVALVFFMQSCSLIGKVFTQKIAHFLNASLWNYLIGHAFRPESADCCSWSIKKKTVKKCVPNALQDVSQEAEVTLKPDSTSLFRTWQTTLNWTNFPSAEKGFPFFPNLIEYSSITINQEDGSKKFHSYLILSKGRHLKRYSVISITLRYIFALLHNALTLRRKLSLLLVIALGYREPLLLLTVIALSL